MTEKRPNIVSVWMWRHPRPQGAAGRCIGQTDLAVDRRKAKRLAHRIRTIARKNGLPRIIWTSPLQRACATGRALRRWGWHHCTDPRLSELYFGQWEGLHWHHIDSAEVAHWEANFLHHAPGGGESQADLRARMASFFSERATEALTPPHAVLMVSHAGCISSMKTSTGCEDAAHWPRSVAYMQWVQFAIDRSCSAP